MFSVNLREDIKDTFWRECGNIEFRYISSVVLEDFLRYMITRHFRSYGYKDEGKMYHFALARSTRREKKDLRFDCDECSFFRLYHIKCEESKSRFWNIVLWGEKKRYYTFNPFFCCAVDISKMSLWSAFTKNRRRIYYTIGRYSSLMTNMQIVGSIVCSLSPVSEKKCLHSPSHLCASKRGHVCFFMLNMMRIGRKTNFITNRILKMVCTNAHFRAEWRKRDPFF